MTKKLIHVLVLLAAVLALAVSYIGVIALPVKIETLIVEELAKATGKNIYIKSVQFDAFKGLVLEGLIVYDRNSILIWAKSVSCGIPISVMFKERMAIPVVTINSPAIYLERRSDNSINLAELASVDYKPGAVASVAFNRIIVKNARVIFIDRALKEIFKERFDDISMDLRLSLPHKIAIILAGNIPGKIPTYFSFSGIYSVDDEELAGRAAVKNLALMEFEEYYKASGITFPKGYISAEALLRIKEKTVELDTSGRIEGLQINKDAMNLKLDSSVKLMLQYDLKENTCEYAGKLDLSRMDIIGVETLGRLENIRAIIEFNDSRLWSDNIIVEAYKMRWKARINVVNFAQPVFDIYADSEAARLSVIQKMLEDEFGIKLPTEISGKADISLALHAQPDKPLKVDGYITLRGATISLGSGNFPIEDVTGEAQFNLNGAKWSDIKMIYRDVPYVSSGTLLNFDAPKIELNAASKDLTFGTSFSARGPIVKFSRLEGRYFNSDFSMIGEIGFKEKNVIDADIGGTLNLELKDLKKIVKNSAGLQKMKPAGKVNAEFSLSGNLRDLKRCAIRAKIKSPYVSVYGLKLTDMITDYLQENGLGQIRSIRSLFYNGSLYGSGKIDWMARALPYSFNIDAKDVKLESLKNDTGFKDKNVSGVIKALAGLSGTFKDITRFNGTGRISITNGRLWQLNLFKGVGSIIFTNDFSDIVFTDGSCDIKMVTRGVAINNFILKSDLLNIYGSGVIGFDKSVNALLRPEVNESDISSSAQERIARAVSSNTEIKITGTIEKPEYKTQANFGDVVGGIATAIFQK